MQWYETRIRFDQWMSWPGTVHETVNCCLDQESKYFCLWTVIFLCLDSTCSIWTGEIRVCPAQREAWCCDAGERFSPVGEEPAPRQTGEPRAGAQGKKTRPGWCRHLSILCPVLDLEVHSFWDFDAGVSIEPTSSPAPPLLPVPL